MLPATNPKQENAWCVQKNIRLRKYRWYTPDLEWNYFVRRKSAEMQELALLNSTADPLVFISNNPSSSVLKTHLRQRKKKGGGGRVSISILFATHASFRADEFIQWPRAIEWLYIIQLQWCSNTHFNSSMNECKPAGQGCKTKCVTALGVMDLKVASTDSKVRISWTRLSMTLSRHLQPQRKKKAKFKCKCVDASNH